MSVYLWSMAGLVVLAAAGWGLWIACREHVVELRAKLAAEVKGGEQIVGLLLDRVAAVTKRAERAERDLATQRRISDAAHAEIRDQAAIIRHLSNGRPAQRAAWVALDMETEHWLSEDGRELLDGEFWQVVDRISPTVEDLRLPENIQINLNGDDE